MYKDVGKRILAVVVTICLVIMLVNVQGIEVRAESAKTYHDYMYGGNENSGYVTADTAAAVFMTNQNESGGAEILSSISFDLHAEDETDFIGARANVSVYTSPTPGDPGSGTFLCSSENCSLTEGINELSFDTSTVRLNYGECYTVVVTLTGEGLSFYTDTFSEKQCTFIRQEDGSWKDMGEAGQSIAIRVTTYDEGLLVPASQSLLKNVANLMSGFSSDDVPLLDDTLTEDTEQEKDTAALEDDTEENTETDDTDTEQDSELPEEDTETADDILPDSNSLPNHIPAETGIATVAEEIVTPVGNNFALDCGSSLTLPKSDVPYLIKLTGDTSQVTQVTWSITSQTTGSSVSIVNADSLASNATEIYILAEEANASLYAVLTAEIKYTDTAGTHTTSVTCNITVRESIKEIRIQGLSDVVYDGTNQKPAITVVTVDELGHEETLPANQNLYTVTYGDLGGSNVNVNAGTVTVTVSGNGGMYTQTATATFEILPKDIRSITVGNAYVDEASVLQKSDIEAAITAALTDPAIKNPDGSERNPVYQLTDADYDIVESSWEENWDKGGTHTVTIQGAGNYDSATTLEVEYSISKSIENTENALIVVAAGGFNGDYTYTTQQIRPEVTVTYMGRTLSEGTDYELAYGENLNAGTGTVTISGIGEYCGVVEKTFTIAPKYINFNNEANPVTVVPEVFTVVGRPSDGSEPDVPDYKVVYGSYTLQKDTDFTISGPVYSDASGIVLSGYTEDAVSAEITITGIGNFAGSRILNYSIGTSIEDYINEGHAVNLTGISKEADGSYSDVKYTGKKVDVSVTIEGLTEGVDFFVECSQIAVGKAQVVIQGMGSYGGTYIVPNSESESEYTFKIVPKDVADADFATAFEYETTIPYSKDAANLKPEVVISYNGTEYVLNADTQSEEFEIEYSISSATDVTAGGTAGQDYTITIKGKQNADLTGTGNFTGEKTLSYHINPGDLSSSKTVVTMNSQYRYTGGTLDITDTDVYEFTVTYNGEELVKDVDYEVEYLAFDPIDDSKDPTEYFGTKMVVITAKSGSNYINYKEEFFEIIKIPLNEVEIIVGDDTNPAYDTEAAAYVDQDRGYRAYKKYTGSEITLPVTLKYNGGVVAAGNYKVTFRNNKEMSSAGSVATITISATEEGNFAGEVTIPFLIYKVIGEDNVAEITSYPTYTGGEISLSGRLSVTTEEEGLFGSTTKTLVEGSDYLLQYAGDHTNAGTDKEVQVVSMPQSALPTETGCYIVYDENTSSSAVSRTYQIKALNLGTLAFGDSDGNALLQYGQIEKEYTGTAITLSEEDFEAMNLEFRATAEQNWLPLTYQTDYSDSGVYNSNDQVTQEGETGATVRILGTGNFTGFTTVTFRIVGRSLDNVEMTITDLDETKYTGEAVKPEFTLVDSDNGKTLVWNTDYTIDYGEYINAGEAYIEIIGKGVYAGSSRSYPYSILPLDISGSSADGTIDLSGFEDSYDYQPGGVEPVPAQVMFTKAGDGRQLILLPAEEDEEKDYKIVGYRGSENHGEATIQIQGTGNYCGVYEKTYTINQKSLADEDIIVLPDPIPDQPFDGEYAMYVTPNIVVYYVVGEEMIPLTEKVDYKLSYSNNFGITGRPATVTVTAVDGSNYTGSREPMEFRIGTSLGDSEIVVTYNDPGNTYTYTGEEIVPSVTVTSSLTGMVLEEGTDYAIEKDEYDNINPGPARIKITGLNKYIGEVIYDFVIEQRRIDDSVRIELPGGENYEYTGEAVIPEVNVIYTNPDTQAETVLAPGEDYQIDTTETYTELGDARIVIIGVGNFGKDDATLEASFKIVPKSIGSGSNLAEGFQARIAEQIYTGEPTEPQVTLTYQNTPSSAVIALEEGIDYTLEDYQDNVEIGYASFKIVGQGNYTGSVTQYYVIKGEISAGNVTIEVADAFFEDYYDEATEQLAPITPEVTVTYRYPNGSEETLRQDIDYTVTYGNNDRVGKASVTISGKGAFGGASLIGYFNIYGDLSKADVEEIEKQPYTGDIIVPEVVVTYRGQQLEAGTHYTSSSDSRDITDGEATAALTLTGKEGYFIGGQTVYFEIYEKEGLVVTIVNPESYMYTGSQIKPEVSVTCDGQPVKTADCTITYGTNINAGTNAGTVTVSFNGLTETKKFTIYKFNLGQANVYVKDNGVYGTIRDQEYLGGNPIEPGNYEIVLLADDGVTELVTFESRLFRLEFPQGDNINPGVAHAVVRANAVYADNFTDDTLETTFNIVPKDLSGVNIMVMQNGYTYNGELIIPEVILMGAYQNAEAGVDYDIVLVDPENGYHAGTQEVKVIAKSEYFTGESKAATFEIAPFDITASNDVTIEPIPAYDYTGTAIEPEAITVSYKGTVLERESDYTVTYVNNVNAGENTAVAQITGVNDFTGMKTWNFTINKIDINTADLEIPNGVYDGNPVEADVILKLGEVSLTQGVDYTVTYEDADRIGPGTVNLTIEGKGNFYGTISTSFKIVANKIEAATVEGVEASYVYEGKPIYPQGIVVKFGSVVLTEDEYSIEYGENLNVGTGTVTILAKGDEYGGSKTIEFTIVPMTITEEMMDGFVQSLPYNGGAVEQGNVVMTHTIGDTVYTLVRGEDYVLECINNQIVTDSALMTITGINNYTGSFSKTYQVRAATFDDIELGNFSSTYTYNGSPIVPQPTVSVGGKELTAGVDYRIELSNNTNAGTAVLSVAGQNNYAGSVKDFSFTIEPKTIHGATIDSIGAQVYNGVEVRPQVAISDYGRALVEGTDYELSYDYNTRPGTGRAIITGKGNYMATKYVRFDIIVGPVTNLNVTGYTDSSVTLGWDKTGVVTGFEIYRIDEDGHEQIIARTAKTTYTDSQLTSGESYSYFVRPYYLAPGSTASYGDTSPVVNVELP